MNEGHLEIALNLVWVLMAGFLVMFMQVGFAMVETGFTRAKNAVNTMAMNMIIYPIGVLGFWLLGYGLMMGGVPGWPSLGEPLRGRARGRPLASAATTWASSARARFALLTAPHDPAQPGDVPLRRGLHGHGRHHPDRRDGRALALRLVSRLRPLHVDAALPALRQLGLGRRLARRDGGELGARAWSRRFRRLVGGAHDRRD